MKKWIRRIAWAMLVLIALLLFSFTPVLSLEQGDMSVLKGEYVDVHYLNQLQKASQILAWAEREAPLLQGYLNATPTDKVSIYIYDDQATLQQKKYGRLTRLFRLPWYVGDVKKGAVLLSAPEATKDILVHELVHVYTQRINPDISYWLGNGLATYLAGQAPKEDRLIASCAPSYSLTREDGLLTPLHFAEADGYAFSYSYVSFLSETYSWGQLMELMRTMDFQKAFGESEKAIYNEWINRLRLNAP